MAVVKLSASLKGRPGIFGEGPLKTLTQGFPVETAKFSLEVINSGNPAKLAPPPHKIISFTALFLVPRVAGRCS